MYTNIFSFGKRILLEYCTQDVPVVLSNSMAWYLFVVTNGDYVLVTLTGA